MSTRANIVVKDQSGETLIFYRHSDGYPEGVKPTLDKFVEMLKAGKIRDNTSQGAGWLVILGHQEYAEHNYSSMDWKVGAYEPTTQIHGDIEHLYLIDMSKKKWREIPSSQWDKYEPKK